MGFGNWIEEREFKHPPNLVFETLVAVLNHSGFTIQSWDPTLRGVTAGSSSVGFPSAFEQSWHLRAAASVQPKEDGASIVTLEIGPAFDAKMFGEKHSKKQVEQLLNDLKRVLEEPPQ